MIPPNPIVELSVNENKDCIARSGFPCSRAFTKCFGAARFLAKFMMGFVMILGNFLHPLASGRKKYLSYLRVALNWYRLNLTKGSGSLAYFWNFFLSAMGLLSSIEGKSKV